MSINLRLHAQIVARRPVAPALPRLVIITATYLVLAVILLWPSAFDGRVPLPLGNSALQGDPVWSGAANVTRPESANLLLGDVSGFYYPYLVYTVERLQAGDLPLWNPGIFGGMPYFAANQSALLYPVNLIAFWFGPYQYWAVAATLRMLIAGWGMYLLTRRLSLHPVAAWIAGVVFMLADFNIVWLHYAIHNVVAFLPLSCFVIHRLVARSAHSETSRASVGDVLALGLLVAAQMFGGHPEMSLFFLVVSAAFALAFVERGDSRTGWKRLVAPARRLGRVGAGMALGLLLSAVQWMPTLALLRGSYTYAERSFAAAQGGEAGFAPLGALRQAGWDNIRSWLLFVQPQLWGTPRGAAIANWGPPGTNYNEMTPFVGLGALALVIFGAWHGVHRAAARFFGGLLIASVLLLYPLPGLGQLGYLPLLDVAHGFRFGAAIALSAAVLAGLAIDRLLQQQSTASMNARWITSRRRLGEAWTAPALRAHLPGAQDSPWAVLAAIALALAALSVMATALVVSPWAAPVLGIPANPATQAQIAGVYAIPNWRLALPAASGVLLAIIMLAARFRSQRSPRAIVVAVCALVAMELLAYGHGYNGVIAPRAIYPSTAATAFLAARNDAGRVLPLDDAFWANTAMTHGIEVTGGMDDLLPVEQQRFLRRGRSGISARASTHVVLDWGQRLADLSSADYIVSRRPVVAQDSQAELPLVMRDGELRVYRNDTALPRAFAAYHAVGARPGRSEDTAYAAGFNPRQSVVVEGQAPAGVQTRRPVEPVTIVRRDPDLVVLDAQVDAPAVVVLTDAYDPGWRVAVDGQPATLLRANGMFRGVTVPAGRHTIRFQYQPAPVVWGGVISLVGIAALLTALLAGVRLPGVRAGLPRPLFSSKPGRNGLR